MTFDLDQVDMTTFARSGRLVTNNGTMNTPAYLTVATKASVAGRAVLFPPGLRHRRDGELTG